MYVMFAPGLAPEFCIVKNNQRDDDKTNQIKAVGLLALGNMLAQPADQSAMAQGNQSPINQTTVKKKVLFVVTSHDKKGSTGQPTGYYLSEVSHPWQVLTAAGYEVDFVSQKGGTPPAGVNLNDPVNKAFVDDKTALAKINHSLTPAEVRPTDYATIHFADGHGTMWDFADNVALADITAKIYENGGAVSAVCHGPAGLVNVRLIREQYLVAGKRVNDFTNEEETAVKLEQVVPFLLESKLIGRGAKFERAGLWQEKVVTDGRLITGQNPASARKVGKSLPAVLQIQNLIAAGGK